MECGRLFFFGRESPVSAQADCGGLPKILQWVPAMQTGLPRVGTKRVLSKGVSHLPHTPHTHSQ